MPYVVTQSCCADASCVVACPVNCIHPAPGEPGFATTEMLYVDPQACVDCGACATACPVDAIKPHTRLTPAEAPFAGLNADYFAVFPHRERTPLAVVPKQRRLRRPGPFRVAVVGSGPAGMYTADELLRHPEITVDVLDRLVTPYGLLRAGVAPDHPHTKRAERLFRQVETQRGFRYLLGVEVGRDVDLAELRRHYDAVVYAVGAAADRPLGVPGEDLPGSLSATEVVGWYNGHPDRRDVDVRLDHERVVVVGTGNVALDVARVLTADPDRLAATDIDETALAALRGSRVREVVLLGRRGPAQAAFTLPELVGLAGRVRDGEIDVRVETGGLPIETAAGPVGRRDGRAELLRELADGPDRGLRRVVLRFLRAPVRLVGEDRVTGIEVGRTELVADEAGVPRAKPTGETEVLEAGMVLRSVGYRGLPVADLPHDEATGTVPNDAGRVEPGVYVAGWAKRGPTGFIGTNKACAQETVERLLDDLDDLDAGTACRSTAPPPGAPDLPALLARRGVPVVDLAGWHALDAEERRRGEAEGRPRAKIADPAQQRRVAGAARRSRYASGRT